MTDKQQIKCLFGFHEYTIFRKGAPNKYDPGILMCQHCQRFGRYTNRYLFSHTWWFEYDKDGNLIHRKNSAGYEQWCDYDEKGHKIHKISTSGHETWESHDEEGHLKYCKNSYGHEWWFNNQGECIKHEHTLVQ